MARFLGVLLVGSYIVVEGAKGSEALFCLGGIVW